MLKKYVALAAAVAALAAATVAATPVTTGVFNSSDRSGDRIMLASGKSFVGPVDDPVFVDLGATFDGINF